MLQSANILSKSALTLKQQSPRFKHFPPHPNFLLHPYFMYCYGRWNTFLSTLACRHLVIVHYSKYSIVYYNDIIQHWFHHSMHKPKQRLFFKHYKKISIYHKVFLFVLKVNPSLLTFSFQS